MNNKNLQNELKNLFQLNNKDLDFGVYKIYGVLNEKITKWLDEVLEKKIEQVLDKNSKAKSEDIEKKLNKKITEINKELEIAKKYNNQLEILNEKLLNLGKLLKLENLDNEVKEKLLEIQDLNEELKQLNKSQNLDNEISEYIFNFYNGIYSDGDFILPRKIDVSNDVNASDTIFDWKTKGQILIKNFDLQTYFDFQTDSGYKIKFKVAEIVDYGDNAKNKSRYLIPIDFKFDKENKELVCDFVLGKLDDKTFDKNFDDEIKIKNKFKNFIGKINNENLFLEEEKYKNGKIKKGNYILKYKDFKYGKNEDALLGKDKTLGAIHLIKLFLDNFDDIDNFKQELFNTTEQGILDKKQKALEIYQDAKGNSYLLRKHLRKWYRLGTNDFFLNQNLKQELEQYKKEFIFKSLYSYILEAGKGDENKAQVLKVFEEIIDEINSFLVTIEDIQIKLYNQKKFIYETHYVITIDRLKTLDLSKDFEKTKEFLKNYFIDDIIKAHLEDYKNNGFLVEQIEENNFIKKLLENDKLYIDTKLVINKQGQEFFEVYGKTFELLTFISDLIKEFNSQIEKETAGNLKEETKQVLIEKLKYLKLYNEEKNKLEKFYLEDLLNGELYKGDNYHALNLLQDKYKEEIKTIYIDPPYNTGSDGFVYKDNMKHSTWLSMMESRLVLAKELMKEEGVIFSSIDDNEVDNLKKLESMVFGDENFIENFIWEKTQHFGRQKINSYSNGEFILSFSKKVRKEGVVELLVERIKRNLEDAPLYNNSNPVRTLIFPKGKVKFNIKDGEYTSTANNNFILKDKVIVKNGKNENDLILEFNSRWGQENINKEVKQGTTFIVKSEGFSIRAIYSDNKESKEYSKKIIFTNSNNPLCVYDKFGNKVGTTDEGSRYIKKLFGNNLLFTYPKPVSLIGYLISLVGNNSYILDFFPGSGTTADAVIRLNAEDLGNRKFILTEINDYFDTIIIPRIKKVAYSLDWKGGKPQDQDGPGIFFKYSYLSSYEDTLENFVVELENTLNSEEFQKTDLENNLYNLATIIGIAFEKTKLNFKTFQNKQAKTYPSYKLTTKRNDIHTFVEETYGKKTLKSFVDLIHFKLYEGKDKLKYVENKDGEILFITDEKEYSLKDIDLNNN